LDMGSYLCAALEEFIINLFVEQDSEIRDDKPAKSNDPTDE